MVLHLSAKCSLGKCLMRWLLIRHNLFNERYQVFTISCVLDTLGGWEWAKDIWGGSCSWNGEQMSVLRTAKKQFTIDIESDIVFLNLSNQEICNKKSTLLVKKLFLEGSIKRFSAGKRGKDIPGWENGLSIQEEGSGNTGGDADGTHLTKGEELFSWESQMWALLMETWNCRAIGQVFEAGILEVP